MDTLLQLKSSERPEQSEHRKTKHLMQDKPMQPVSLTSGKLKGAQHRIMRTYIPLSNPGRCPPYRQSRLGPAGALDCYLDSLER